MLLNVKSTMIFENVFYPTYEMLDICCKRYYYNNQTSFKNRFKLWLIDRLTINVKNDVRYAYRDISEEERKMERHKIQEHGSELTVFRC